MVLPKLAFVAVRLVAEYLIGFLFANLHDTALSMAADANTLASNLVADFENWLIYGKRGQRPVIPPAASAAAASSSEGSSVQGIEAMSEQNTDIITLELKALPANDALTLLE